MLQLFLLLLEVVYLFLAFKSGEVIYFVIAVGLGGWWFYEINKETRRRDKEIEETTIQEVESHPHTRYIISSDFLQVLMLDERSDTFRILEREEIDDEFDVKEFGFHEIYEVAIVEDGNNIALTSKGGVHGWSLIDGGTKLGVHVDGAESEKKEKSKEVKKLMLKIVVDDLSNPIYEYIFLDNEQAIPKDLDEYKDLLKECQKWYQKVSVIIKRNERERQDVAINGAH